MFKQKQKAIAYLEKVLKPYMKKGYVFSPDTNFFMECPEIFQYLKASNEKVLISKVTFDELDNGKSATPDASQTEQQRAQKRRKGLEAMDHAQAIRVPTPAQSYISGKKLGLTNDEKIIASYLKYAEDTKEQVLFLTLDRGAKTIARSVDLSVAEFDITEYFKLKQAEHVSVSKAPRQRAYPKRKKKNPLTRAFQQLFQGVYSLIIGLLRLVVFGFIGLLVLALIVAGVKNAGHTKAFNHIVGDQGVMAVNVSSAKNQASDNKYRIELELTNHTSEEVLLKGYYTKDDLERKASLEKDTNPNSMTKLALEHLKEGMHAVKVHYKDGTEEVQLANERLQSREKKTIVIASNGQLNEIEKINLQFKKASETELNLLTIDPLE